MVEKNSLGKSFGPVGSIAGIILLVAGIVVAFYSLSGLILIPFGAFVGLTYSSATIDLSKKRVKNALNLFGIIPIGKWITIEPDMKISIRKSNLTWRTYSKSNRTMDIKEDGYLITLNDSANQAVLPIKRTKSIELAKHESVHLAKNFGLLN